MAPRHVAFTFATVGLVWLLGAALAAAAPPAHLVPFPEDVAPRAAARVTKPEPPKSDFRPKFRSPNLAPSENAAAAELGSQSGEPQELMRDNAVVPASAAEPIVERLGEFIPEQSGNDSAEISPTTEGPQLLPGPGPVDPASLQGREALNEAFSLSKKATTAEDYTSIIAMCERGKVGVSQQYQDYASQLTGWAHNRRGEMRAKGGDEAAALVDFEAAVRLGGAWRAVHNRGVSYAAAGRMEEALADFNRTIQLNPRYANAFYNRAELHYRQENYPAAISDYTQALQFGPADAATYNGRGHSFYRMQAFGDALRDYGEAIKLDPTNPDPLINRGDTHSDLGQYGEAAADYRTAVQIAPENARAFQAAAWLMATCPDNHYRDEALAVDAAKRAIELEGVTYRNLSTLAAAQAGAGLFQEAQATQEKAIGMAPENQVVTGEKMMALYQREIAYRDRPLTSYQMPEELSEDSVVQAAATDLIEGKAKQERQALFQAASPEAQAPRQAQRPQPQPQAPPSGMSRYGTQAPPARDIQQQRRLMAPPVDPRQQQPEQPQPRARLFAPKGRI